MCRASQSYLSSLWASMRMSEHMAAPSSPQTLRVHPFALPRQLQLSVS